MPLDLESVDGALPIRFNAHKSSGYAVVQRLYPLVGAGKEHGKLDDGQEKGITPEKAAEIILKGMLRNKREILVGKEELLMLHIRRYFPWLFFRIADKLKST